MNDFFDGTDTDYGKPLNIEKTAIPRLNIRKSPEVHYFIEATLFGEPKEVELLRIDVEITNGTAEEVYSFKVRNIYYELTIEKDVYDELYIELNKVNSVTMGQDNIEKDFVYFDRDVLFLFESLYEELIRDDVNFISKEAIIVKRHS